ncbi:alcohol dehydrogenase GroES-like domain protein [Mycobacterium xenopi 4042]|uniref:Alcohol dehydrogenase GroES-like domain protein n=1 Tax=Mycobacterium xenopi 4042 TaxID=1299334 RepID=X7YP86_MYCXE|nr:alcohol dehydrogenase GroES-like domain protein [Mycobacterium xenopi 4042]
MITAAQSRCPVRMSPIWGPRCGGWCGRRKPSIRAVVLADVDCAVDDAAVAAIVAAGAAGVPARRCGADPRVHGCRAVAGLLVPPTDRPWRLGLTSAGTFENLTLEPIPKPTRSYSRSGPGRTQAIAANFRDVMITLGLYPDDDAVMGIEAAGIVVETGSDDCRFAVGDRVMGLFPEGPARRRSPTSGC